MPQQTEIWDDIKEFVRARIPSVEFHTWFESVRPMGVTEGAFTIGVANSFAADWLRRNYSPLLEEALRGLGAESPRVAFKVLPSQQQATVLEPEDPARPSAAIPKDGRAKLNPKYTYENFVVGPHNNLANAAALAVAEAPGKTYNPLFIYGGVGLGKTHLMHAVGHKVVERFPHLKIEYLSTETFTNEVVTSIREDRMAALKDKYRNIDLLMLDDIQFIAGKERTQEEFFHTFNALYENNKQIILSSDRPPREILTLEARLRSRFEWGLITDITSPEFETRVAILRMNADYRHVRVPEDVLELIARQVTTNIRELEGALMRVIAYASLNGMDNEDITRAVAAKALSNVFTKQDVALEMRDILAAVAQHYRVNAEQLRGTGRAREIVVPRQVAMYLIRELTSHSLPEIGQYFSRDHTTVLYSIQKVTEAMGPDETLTKAVDEIRGKVK
ncbi:MAG TPA: chromosomal replication initiator protein DnaA [Deinococcales bacterium]|nr:chromosomal replication initiator protein DnaA [Deinococcales bacterium]